MKRSPRSACMLLAPICDPAMTGVCLVPAVPHLEAGELV